jgi:phosphoserine aminotransferase
MVSFYPGPSQIYPQVADYLLDAYNSGILSANHRSQKGMDLVQETVLLFRQKLNLPSDYSIYFTSSATECWEIISQSFKPDRFLHIYNGAFGKKWFEYSQKLNPNHCQGIQFELNELLPKIESFKNDIICITQNETSNGTQIGMDSIATIKNQGGLIAIDATSSMAGIELNWALGDIWLASVQKCFGLPAGLGILVCSAKAIQFCEQANQQNHYNSLLNIHKNMALFQTAYTPNVLGIYLLSRVLQQIESISETSNKIKKQAKDWYNFFKNNNKYKLLAQNASTRSDTVIVVSSKPEAIEILKQHTLKLGLTLGNGYGEFKTTTFRIANFPAINIQDINRLREILNN